MPKSDGHAGNSELISRSGDSDTDIDLSTKAADLVRLLQCRHAWENSYYEKAIIECSLVAQRAPLIVYLE